MKRQKMLRSIGMPDRGKETKEGEMGIENERLCKKWEVRVVYGLGKIEKIKEMEKKKTTKGNKKGRRERIN